MVVLMHVAATQEALYEYCRDGDVGRLSVTQLQGATVTTYATGVESANTSAIPLMDEVYVGGISSTMMVYRQNFKDIGNNLLNSLYLDW